MKLLTMFFTTLCMAAMANAAKAQAPAGFVNGTVTLSNGSTLNGYVKESIKKNAAITFTDAAGNNKQKYDGIQINAAMIDSVNYLCIKGDFFKTICTGKICFLQKASNAANKSSFNGNEVVFNSGTDGKIGDYFAYINNQLTHLTKKNINKFIDEELGNNAVAVEKAKVANGDMSLLAAAVIVYNNAVK